MGNCAHNLLTEYDEVILNMKESYDVSTFRSGKLVTKIFKSPKKALNQLEKLHYETLKIYSICGSQVNFLDLFLKNININKLRLSLYPHSCADVDKFTDLLNHIVRIGELTIEINVGVLDFEVQDKKEWIMSIGNLLLKLSEMKQKNIIAFVDFSHYISQIGNDNIHRLQTYIEDQIKFEMRGNGMDNGLYIKTANDITDASNIKVIMYQS
jgi:hypothetical protein